jgi:thioredoxin-like negative regulator of GroEL
MSKLGTLLLGLALIGGLLAVPDRAANATRSITNILVFVTADCADCNELEIVLKRAVDEADGRVRLTYVNAQETPEIAERYGIRYFPTVLALRHGEPTYWFVGTADDLEVVLFIQHVTSI